MSSIPTPTPSQNHQYSAFEMNHDSGHHYDGLQVVANDNTPDKQAYSPYPQSSYHGTGTTAMPGYTAEDPIPKPEKRVAGMRRSTLILTSVVVLLLAAIALIGGLFGSKIGTLEDKIAKFGSNTATPTGTTGDDPTQTTPDLSATETDIAVSGYEYLGCFEDGSDRTLANGSSDRDTMTNAQCAVSCSRFKYFGTEFGSQCYCGSELTRTKAVPPWHCATHCAGAEAGAENCGGFFYLSLWQKTS